MATKSPITNDEIKTKPTNTSFRNGWERAFLKKPQDWLEALYGDSIKMLDPDGFREKDGVTWETPMTKKEFEKRFVHCTIMGFIMDNKPMKATLVK